MVMVKGDCWLKMGDIVILWKNVGDIVIYISTWMI
jgi:hypothetical protein